MKKTGVHILQGCGVRYLEPDSRAARINLRVMPEDKSISRLISTKGAKHVRIVCALNCYVADVVGFVGLSQNEAATCGHNQLRHSYGFPPHSPASGGRPARLAGLVLASEGIYALAAFATRQRCHGATSRQLLKWSSWNHSAHTMRFAQCLRGCFAVNNDSVLPHKDLLWRVTMKLSRNGESSPDSPSPCSHPRPVDRNSCRKLIRSAGLLLLWPQEARWSYS